MKKPTFWAFSRFLGPQGEFQNSKKNGVMYLPKEHVCQIWSKSYGSFRLHRNLGIEVLKTLGVQKPSVAGFRNKAKLTP